MAKISIPKLDMDELKLVLDELVVQLAVCDGIQSKWYINPKNNVHVLKLRYHSRVTDKTQDIIVLKVNTNNFGLEAMYGRHLTYAYGTKVQFHNLEDLRTKLVDHGVQIAAYFNGKK